MKIKTSELQGAALNWAVDKAKNINTPYSPWGQKGKVPAYCTDWSQGGPIIEREGINLEHNPSRCHWIASTPAPEHRNGAVEVTGPTPLVAAMRCYVTSKLGAEVEIPEGLK